MKKLNTYLNLPKTLIVGIVLLGLVTSSSSCNKDKKEPKHRDIVTATINGQPWKAECEESPPFGCIIADLQYYPETGYFSMRSSNVDESIGIVIRLFEINDIGVYKISSGNTCGGITKNSEICGQWRMIIEHSDPQEIEIISIDYENKIIEGSFSFIGRDTSYCLNEPIFIEDGYFNLKYRP